MSTLKNKLQRLAASLERELTFYRRVMAHPRTPRTAKFLLYTAIGYLCMPFDLIPDWLPVIGQLDDLIIVPLLVYLALKMIPAAVITECRSATTDSKR